MKKSNEIKAIPQLLEILVLKGSLVTIDAMGYQREIANKIIEKEADYVLAVKGGQGYLKEDIKRTIHFSKPNSQWGEDDFGHGRIECRKSTLYKDFYFIEHTQTWNKLSVVIQ